MRSPWRFTFLIVAVTAAAGCGGCHCGAKPSGAPAADYSALLKALPAAKVARAQALVPPMPIVIVSSDAKGAWDALLASDLGKALVQGGALESVSLSSQIEELLSLAHVVASDSTRPLVASALAQAMAGRAALGLELDEGDSAVSRFVAVKEIETSQENTVRLAVMLASMRPGGPTLSDHQGQPIAQIQHGSRSLFVSAFQNVVIASNQLELAHAAVDLALARGGKSAESDEPDFTAESASLAGPQVLVRAELKKDGAVAVLTGLEHVLARVELGATAVVKIRAALAAAPGALAAHHAQSFVPKDALLFTSLGAASPAQLLERVGSLSGSDGEAAQQALNLPAELQAALGDEAFYALVGIDGARPEHLAGFAVKDRAKAEKMLAPLLGRLGSRGGQSRELALAPGVTARCHTGSSLCLALVNDYLLAAMDEKQLTASVETALGKRPALSDARGFGRAVKAGDKHFLSLYLDTPLLADAALSFFKAVGTRGQGIDPSDVEETMGPLCQALKALPPFGGALEVQGNRVAGELKALP